jgi:hypothetical protein
LTGDGNLFGETLPGLNRLISLSGPPNLVRGFINGSQMILDEYMEACDELVAVNLVNESERLVNLTLTIFE